MGIEKEIEHFDRVKVEPDTGELDIWDKTIFPQVIKIRQIEVILSEVKRVKPKKILDFGCGAGWLSRVLASSEYDLVGIDVSEWLVRNAVNTRSQNSQFLVGDCMNLPFEDGSFDLILGFGILHHLVPERGLSECLRVAAPGARLLLMEPNTLNPLGALGRKILHSKVHSEGEKTFSPAQLTKLLRQSGWDVKEVTCLFPISFALSYMARVTVEKMAWVPQSIIPTKPILVFEKLVEKIPVLNRLNWLIIAKAEKR